MISVHNPRSCLCAYIAPRQDYYIRHVGRICPSDCQRSPARILRLFHYPYHRSKDLVLTLTSSHPHPCRALSNHPCKSLYIFNYIPEKDRLVPQTGNSMYLNPLPQMQGEAKRQAKIILRWKYPIYDQTGTRQFPTCPYSWPNGQGDVGKFLEGMENSEIWRKEHRQVYRIW